MTSTNNPQFLLDANVFIQAGNRYYAFDICPGFWKCLPALCSSNTLISIDRVLSELTGKTGDWAHNSDHADLFTSSTDASVRNEYARIIGWVNSNPQFLDYAKSDFASGADGWLIAYAIANKMTLVTEEAFDPNIKRRIPIPNVCKVFNVQYINTFDMLRALAVQFSWNPL